MDIIIFFIIILILLMTMICEWLAIQLANNETLQFTLYDKVLLQVIVLFLMVNVSLITYILLVNPDMFTGH